MADEEELRNTQEEFQQLIEESVQKAIRILQIHCDSVRIFVNTHMNGAAYSFTNGAGNWLAQYAQVRLWITQQETIERLKAKDQYQLEMMEQMEEDDETDSSQPD